MTQLRRSAYPRGECRARQPLLLPPARLSLVLASQGAQARQSRRAAPVRGLNEPVRPHIMRWGI